MKSNLNQKMLNVKNSSLYSLYIFIIIILFSEFFEIKINIINTSLDNQIVMQNIINIKSTLIYVNL